MMHAAATVAGTSTAAIPTYDLDPEDLITLTLEEYDHRQSKNKGKEKDQSPGVAAAVHLSEKPGMMTGGRHPKRKGPLECWKCGNKGHKKFDCPHGDEEAAKLKAAKDKDKEKWNGNGNGKGKGKSNFSNAQHFASGSASSGGANIAFLDEVAGAWSAQIVVDMNFEDPAILDEFSKDELDIDETESVVTHASLPSLAAVSDSTLLSSDHSNLSIQDTSDTSVTTADSHKPIQF
jgi:hypothetical protein